MNTNQPSKPPVSPIEEANVSYIAKRCCAFILEEKSQPASSQSAAAYAKSLAAQPLFHLSICLSSCRLWA